MTIRSDSSQGPMAVFMFRNIERVLKKKYEKNAIIKTAVFDALQRLGEAVINQYQLDAQQYCITKTYRLKMDEYIDLSTQEKMLAARISECEEGRQPDCDPSESYYGFSHVKYVLKPSIQETIDMPFSEIKLIVDMDFDRASMFVLKIKEYVDQELSRLSLKGDSQEKILEINRAMEFLEAAVAHKYASTKKSPVTLTAEQKNHVESIDLYSFKTMLQAKIGKWSLSQALNLSTGGWMTKIFGQQEVLWGQANALKNLEAHLSPSS